MEKSTLWGMVTASTDILLEIWTIKLFSSGILCDFTDYATIALTRTANDFGTISNKFIDDYVSLVKTRTLLDYFLTSIEPALWDLEGSTIAKYTFAQFLLTVLTLNVRIFYSRSYQLTQTCNRVLNS